MKKIIKFTALFLLSITSYSQVYIEDSTLYFNYEIVNNKEVENELFFSYQKNLGVTTVYFNFLDEDITTELIIMKVLMLSDKAIKIVCSNNISTYHIILSPSLNYLSLQSVEDLTIRRFTYKKISQKTYIHRI